MSNLIYSIEKIDAFVFDFDGVLTDNAVHLDHHGNEFVSCSRSDGLAFDVLRKLGKKSFILSTEKNPIVSSRANKLKIPCIQGVENKLISIKDMSVNNHIDLKNVMYVGNDINDKDAMKICGHSACPSDSHEEIKKISQIVLSTKGGQGVVRELLEIIFKLDFYKILYLD